MINIYIGVKQATVAYLHAVSNESVGVNLSIISNHGIFTDIGKSTDVYILTNFGAGLQRKLMNLSLVSWACSSHKD